ncbi:P-loop NTPase fold protein [Burkholderia sp. Ax-1719]|uniref:KAP family P-loop NTPase fold protein n=1 Tax=Burkholderia sp. Ax-1719 TaxID=2608334 RepID=UPI00141DAB9F|nr:P-loop NTPase fold protein [Burkholderia sp. Ax-1719]NIE66946.1 AAA family ATPase [Burkholderia sp. Ax-1719]
MQKTPTLLLDEPSVEDNLGGAHKKIAKTIATLIETSPGGQTIRLDGTWGSGKSSVVRMLTERLEPSGSEGNERAASLKKDFAVFLYDAWVHSGDPLRRAFLSSLVTKLEDRGWLNEDGEGSASHAFWKRKLANLSRRLKVTTKKTKPIFSSTAKNVLAGFAAVGFAAPILAELEKKLVGSESTARLAIYGGVAVLAAFALVRSLTSEIIGFIIRRNTDEETVETNEEPEPTSVEFQEAFGQLMEAALSVDDRRLLIVIDNLDRIDRSETQSVWTLLRSFLDNPNFSNKKWFRRVWVLVPVADEKRVLLPSVADIVDKQESESPPSFFEKVFQLRFSLPPPMLHSWKNYLNAKLIRAFGEDLTGDYDEILRLYEELVLKSPLTPRGIVSFVNELVVMKLEWGAAASLSSLAAYLLSKEQLSELSCNPPDSVISILREPELADTFAMLHLRAANRTEASYLSARPRLEKVLDNGDSEGLTRLFSDSPAFGHVLDRFIRQDLSNLESQQERLLQAARALAPVLKSNDERIKLPAGALKHLERVMITTLSAGQTLRLLNPNLSAGLTALFEIVHDGEQLANVVITMLRALADKEQSHGPLNKQIETNFEAWVTSLTEVLGTSEIRRLATQPDFRPIALPIDNDAWSKMCLILTRGSQKWALRCCSSLDGDSSEISWLQSQLSLSRTTPEKIALVAYRLETGDGRYFDAAARGMISGCTEQGVTDGESLASHLISIATPLIRLDKERLLPHLQCLMKSNTLLSLYGKLSTRADLEFQRAILYFLIAYASNGIPTIEANDATAKQSADLGAAAKGLDVFKGIGEGRLGLTTTQAEVFANAFIYLNQYDLLKLLSAVFGTRGIVGSVTMALSHSSALLGLLFEGDDPDKAGKDFSEKHIVDELRPMFVSNLYSKLSPSPPSIEGS